MELVLFLMLLAAGSAFDIEKEALNYKEKEIDFNIENYIQTEDKEEYDFVIVGGGNSGLVLASRLSEIDKFKVLVLEAGREECYVCLSPGMKKFLTSTEMNWNFVVEPSNSSCLAFKSNSGRIKSGRVLGGSGSINDMIYSLGNPSEWNLWGANNPEWSWDKVKPVLDQYQDFNLADEGYHCKQGGNLWIENPRYWVFDPEVFITSGTRLGFLRTDQDCSHPNGIGYLRSLTRRGIRENALTAYLRKARHRPNLTVKTRSYVTKVLFDQDQGIKAKGVQYLKDGQLINIKAKREVILAAGAVKNPHLLQLSGIGPEPVLKKANIPQILDLPVGTRTKCILGFWGVNFLFKNPPLLPTSNLTQDIINLLNGHGSLTAIKSGTNVFGLINTKDYQNQSALPELMLIIQPVIFNPGDDIDVSKGLKEEVYENFVKPHLGKPGFNVAAILTRINSEGFIEAGDNDPLHKPKLDCNALMMEKEVDLLVESIKIALRLVQESPLKDYYGGAEALVENLPGCEGLLDDDYWKCYVRHFAAPLREVFNTVRMGTDQDSVIDQYLKVYKVANLRVIGSGVNPEGISGKHTGISILTAEKAARYIISDHL